MSEPSPKAKEEAAKWWLNNDYVAQASALRAFAEGFDTGRAVPSPIFLEYAKRRERELTIDVEYYSYTNQLPGQAQAARYKRSSFRELIAQFEIESAYWLKKPKES